MNDRQRLEMLTKLMTDYRYTDSFELNRTNLSFLIIGYNKLLKFQEENKKLKLQIKMLEMGEKV